MSNTKSIADSKTRSEEARMTLVTGRYGYTKDGSLYLGLIEDTAEIMAARSKGKLVVHLPPGTNLTWNGRAFNVPEEVCREQKHAA